MIKKIIKRIKRKINFLKNTREFNKQHKQDGLVRAEKLVDKYHNRGVDYLEDGKYEKAVKMFIKECHCQQWCPIGHHYLGKTLHLMGGYQTDARICYERALERLREWTKRYPEEKDDLAEMEQEILSDLESLERKTHAATVQNWKRFVSISSRK